MMRVTLAFALALVPAFALAQDEPHPSLEEVMLGATAMTTVANGYLFVTKPGEAWVCAVNVNSNHFAALIAGDEVVAEQTAPGTLCVPASHFKNLME